MFWTAKSSYSKASLATPDTQRALGALCTPAPTHSALEASCGNLANLKPTIIQLEHAQIIAAMISLILTTVVIKPVAIIAIIVED